VNANIDPIPPSDPDGAAGVPRTPPVAASGDLFGATLARAQQASRNAAEWVQATPPPDLSAHIAAAARAWDALADGGRHVSFEEGSTGHLRIELQDDDGNSLESLSVGRLFELIDQHGGT
jgi:hypothetical protein